MENNFRFTLNSQGETSSDDNHNEDEIGFTFKVKIRLYLFRIFQSDPASFEETLEEAKTKLE